MTQDFPIDRSKASQLDTKTTSTNGAATAEIQSERGLQERVMDLPGRYPS